MGCSEGPGHPRSWGAVWTLLWAPQSRRGAGTHRGGLSSLLPLPSCPPHLVLVSASGGCRSAAMGTFRAGAPRGVWSRCGAGGLVRVAALPWVAECPKALSASHSRGMLRSGTGGGICLCAEGSLTVLHAAACGTRVCSSACLCPSQVAVSLCPVHVRAALATQDGGAAWMEGLGTHPPADVDVLPVSTAGGLGDSLPRAQRCLHLCPGSRWAWPPFPHLCSPDSGSRGWSAGWARCSCRMAPPGRRPLRPGPRCAGGAATCRGSSTASTLACASRSSSASSEVGPTALPGPRPCGAPGWSGPCGLE